LVEARYETRLANGADSVAIAGSREVKRGEATTAKAELGRRLLLWTETGVLVNPALDDIHVDEIR
jgi:hypothetical protein